LSRSGVQTQPHTPSVRLQLAEGFYAVGDYKKSAQLYLELLKKLPDILNSNNGCTPG